MSNRRPDTPGTRLIIVVALAAVVLAGCKKESDKTTTTGATPAATEESQPEAGTTGGKADAGEKVPSSPPPAPQAKGEALAPNAVKPSDHGLYSLNPSGVRKFGTTTNPCFPDSHPEGQWSLRISAASGNRQQSDGQQNYDDDSKISTTTVLEFRPDGVYLIYTRQIQTIPVFPEPFVTEFEPSPPVLVFPANPKLGQQWTFTLKSKDGRVTVDATNTIEAIDEPVTLADGATIKAIRVKGDAHVTGTSPLGDLDIRENSTTWVSIEHRLITKSVVDSTGTVGTCRVDGTHIETLLRSTNPS